MPLKRRILLIISIITSILMSAAHAEIVIKFSHIATADSPKGLAALHFKELAEKMTKGKVRVEVYPGGQLFKDDEELEALQLNSIQMLAPTFSKFSSLGIHNFEVFDLPFLFRNEDDLHRITQGAIGRQLLATLTPQGIVGLGYWDNGFKNMSANMALHVPADMRGLKMRIQPSKVIATQMNDLGAIAYPMPFYESFKFLKNGLLDGTETTPSLFATLDLMQSQKYLTMTGHGYMGYVVIVNKTFWDAIPAEIQIELIAAMNETTKYADHIAKSQNESNLLAIKNSGKTSVIELTEAEKKLWIDALQPVEKQTENRIGKELITKIKNELARPEKQQ